MTKELYVNICKKKSDEKQTKRIEISCDFRETIGGFMINPDMAKFCYEKQPCNKLNDWDIKQVTELMEDDPVCGLYALFVVDNDGKNGKCKIDLSNQEVTKWRSHLRNREPYYKYETNRNLANEQYILLNPMALFTNILSPTIAVYKVLKEGYKGFELNSINEWCEDYIMVFPFYSMDYMYRLYEILHARSRARVYNPEKELSISNLLCNTVESVLDIKTLVNQYIPIKPGSTNEKIFVDPIQKLTEIINNSLSDKRKISYIISRIENELNNLRRGLDDSIYIKLATEFHRDVLSNSGIENNDDYHKYIGGFNDPSITDCDTFVNALNVLKSSLANLKVDENGKKEYTDSE